MALSSKFLLFCFLLLFISPSIAKTSFRPKALVLPVTKDGSTLQYLTQIKQRTPLVPVKLTLDLGGQFLWVDCEKEYVSSSYTFAPCHSAPCSLANAPYCFECHGIKPRPGCHNNTCNLLPENTINGISFFGGVSMDVASIQSTDGKNPGKVVSVPKLLFGVTGMAGLGRTKISLPSLFSSAFSFKRKFAICLSSSTKANGAVFFGDGPYVMLPGVDVSKSLTYTPLILNPVTTATRTFIDLPSSDYFIEVKSIKINGHVIPMNTSLLSIDKKGFGGTKISTIHPYTVLESSIYEAFIQAFTKELAKVPRVKPVSPFGACFNSTHIGRTRAGPAVPQIDLVLQSSKAVWSIFGANSMVQVKRDVLCLGFVDGGVHPRTSIVIGGHQLEDNLLQFDLGTARLGFSSSLLFRQTTCSNFNFMSNA
ncbi:peptidase A1 domain-containing protein [Citrus sinensis]|uniref:Peptidase A1 domain-containing protein n=1 Tax=Citrus sinensis TaxID=2711 RepID=A0ACB8I766_CITSI|nr:peptidase A1 domain-containing protein [Citrus sinensis]